VLQAAEHRIPAGSFGFLVYIRSVVSKPSVNQL